MESRDTGPGHVPPTAPPPTAPPPTAPPLAAPLPTPRPRTPTAARHRAPAPDGRSARRLLGATGDRALQTLVVLAARVLDAEAAEIALVTDERTVVLAAHPPADHPLPDHPARPRPAGRTGRDEALCSLVAGGRTPLVVEDAVLDDRVAHLGPVVRGELVAYLGVPLVADDGRSVGALCVHQRRPRTWTAAEQALLVQLATAVAAQLEVAALDSAYARTDRRTLLAGAAHAAGIGAFSWHVEADVLVWDDPLLSAFGYDDSTFPGTIEAFTSRLHPDDLDAVTQALRAAVGGLEEYVADFRAVRPDGGVRWFTARGRATGHPDGGVRVLGAVTDVTALREQEARRTAVLESLAVGYVTLDADWRITYVNPRAERVAGSPRGDLLGRTLWAAFPGTVGTVVEESCRRAVAEQVPVVFEAHHPSSPDLWLEVRATPEDDGLTLHLLDISARRRADEARELATRRLHRTSEFALTLGGAETIDDLVRTVAEEGLVEFGCNGGSVAVPDPADPAVLVSRLTSSYGDRAQVDYGRMPVDTDLPVAEAARTGRTVLVADHAACEAFSPGTAAAAEATGSQAFACLPLRIGTRTIGVVTAGWAEAQPFDADQLGALEAFATQCAQALARLQARAAERAAAARVAGLSTALQRSLLTELPAVTDLDLLARYLPAADEAQVGGDWYDAFAVQDGSTCVVVGDVTGHDQAAAVQMAQVRNVLRGTAHALDARPAAVLRSLDRALRDLSIGALATTVLAAVEPGPPGTAPGTRTLRWSNAGHPPPVLLHADGRAELLDRSPDLMLGTGVTTDRHDHVVTLPPGSTVLLFTDGLVERRGEDLDVGLTRLARAAARWAHLPLPALCEGLLEDLADVRCAGASPAGRGNGGGTGDGGGTGGFEDDVVLFALRTRHPGA